MEKSEKAQLRNSSSVPDIVFYQLKMEKSDNIIGFVDNDSEEHFGKLARKGGEILLPGVLPQKSKVSDDLVKIAKVPDGQFKKGKMKVKLEIQASDTELENFLCYDQSSSSELRLLNADFEIGRELSSRDKARSESDKEVMSTDKEKDVGEDAAVGERRSGKAVVPPTERMSEPDFKMHLIKKLCTSSFGSDSQFSKTENTDCFDVRSSPVATSTVRISDAVLQSQQDAKDKGGEDEEECKKA